MKVFTYYLLLTTFYFLLGLVFFVFYVNGKQDARSDSPVLEIRDTDSGRIYGRWPLEEGEEFAVEFVHSVNQSPVREIFVNEGGEMRLRALRFYSFGAGMPFDFDVSGGRTLELRHDEGAMMITGFSVSFRGLNYIVGTVSDHLLLINGKMVSLRDLCGRNAHITMRIR